MNEKLETLNQEKIDEDRLFLNQLNKEHIFKNHPKI